jgi:hypothetical protein
MLWKRLAFILSMTLMLVAIPFLAIAQNGEAVSVGDVIEGQLTLENLTASYTILAAEGDRLLLTLRSSDFDSYLTLLAQDGSIVAEDDDGAGGMDALIEAELPSTGLYTIQASSYTLASTGAFTLTIEGSVSDIPTPTPIPTRAPLEQVPIVYGQSLDGVLTANDVTAAYTFEGQTGDRVTVTLTSPDFDVYLRLFVNGAASPLAEDDDSAGNLNARIQDFELPAAGMYMLEVSSIGDVSGAYTLTLEGQTSQVTVEAITGAPGAGPGSQTIAGLLMHDLLSAPYPFEGRAGDTIAVTMTSVDFDSYLYLQDSRDEILAADDDGAGNLNARIVYTLPADGTYTLVATSNTVTRTGAYVLTVVGIESPLVLNAPWLGISPDTRIQFGDVVDGALSDTHVATYRFDGEAGQTVTIVATSGEFDIFLTLSDSSGSELVSDDDSAGNLNARIENFTLPASDSYTITVSSFAQGASGAFTLILESVEPSGQPTPTPAPMSTGNTIRIGETINGSLRAGQQSTTYTFEGRSGQSVTITVRSEAFDTYLRVSDPQGVELAYDDDGGGNLDSRINLFRVPADGVYTISVESYDGNSGGFTLAIEEPTIRNIEYTQIINETLTAGEIAAYRFSGRAGESVVINLRGVFDTYLTLADSNGATLMENDDSGSSTSSLIGPYTLLTDGEYLVYVRSYDNTASGAYTLRVDRAELIRLSYGEEINVVFEAQGGPMYFDFEGSYGDVITIRVNSNNRLDTALILNGPDGYQLIADEDGGAGFDPEIFNYGLNQDGAFILVLRTAVPGDSGQVTLTLEKAEARSLDDGPQEVTVGNQHSQDFVSFTGRAGERVMLTVEILTPPGVYSPYVSAQQGDQTLYYGYGAYLSRQVVELTVPADGKVIVELEFYDSSKARLRLALETLGR